MKEELDEKGLNKINKMLRRYGFRLHGNIIDIEKGIVKFIGEDLPGSKCFDVIVYIMKDCLLLHISNYRELEHSN